MVVSSGFLDHVLTMERSDVYLRANGLISNAAQPINNTVNRQQVHILDAHTHPHYLL